MDESEHPRFTRYEGPAGGWGSVASLANILHHQQVMLRGPGVLAHQNRTEGFACVSCAWAKPAKPHLFEFCENGAKACAWEMTRKNTGQDFFSAHPVAELHDWYNYDLEEHGRRVHPLRWDAA